MSKTFRYNTDAKRVIKRVVRPLHGPLCRDKHNCRCFDYSARAFNAIQQPPVKREVKNYWSVNGDV